MIKMFYVKRYSEDLADEWNAFVSSSKNGTFLFNRAYMDYHQDRFTDHSLIIYDENHIRALLPANAKSHILYSHQGLTYGGLITNEKTKAAEVCAMFCEINNYLQAYDFRKVTYKPIPYIYQRLPSGEDLYALTNVCHATITSRNISSTIIMDSRIGFDHSRMNGMRMAKKLNLAIKESDDIPTFWEILNDNLSHKYNASPVHTCNELLLLKSRFPNNIRLYIAYRDEVPLGGTIIYITPQTVHTQYISASPEGKRLRVLDALLDYVINLFGTTCKYFDFGISNEDNGRYLNEKLIFQKEGFGGRGVCYDTYEYEL